MKFISKAKEFDVIWEQYDGIPNKENNARILIDSIFKQDVYDLKNHISASIDDNTLTDTQYRNLIKLKKIMESIWIYPDDAI